MIARIVSFALHQRFVIIMGALALMVWGAISFQKLPIDAYPDLSPPHVEIITQWPGHAAEEVERLISIPLEVEMNGIPKIDALRSISLTARSWRPHGQRSNGTLGGRCARGPMRTLSGWCLPSM